MVDYDGCPALHIAVLCGRMRMVKALVRSNPKLMQLANNDGRVPLGISAVEASMHKEIVWFLAKSTTDDGPSHPFSNPSALKTMIGLTFSGHHDITLYLVGRYPHLFTMKSEGSSILDGLARMAFHFPSGTRLSVLEALTYICILVELNYKPIDKYSHPALQCLTRSFWNAAKIVEGHVLYQATIMGVSEIVKLCIQFFPEVIRISPYDMRLTTHAVSFRRERTLSLFLKVSSTNEFSLVPGPTREDSSRMMLAAAKRAARYHPSFNAVTDVAGAAFHMQRELQWYKAVESCVTRDFRTARFTGKTAWNIFVEEQKELLEKGEKWVKDTADKYMLVSTVIATVLFAATFTMPGGNNDKTGVLLLLGQDSLLVFAISDALGLFFSVTVILLFLAILTSRYEPQDFLDLLPKKIIMGLCFLFLSLAFMLVAFAATLTIVLDKRLEWVLIPITLLASVPVALFVVL